MEKRSHYKDTRFASFLGKFLVFMLFIPVWFGFGGFFTIGPFIAHNIDKAVGKLFLFVPAASWAILPFTFLSLLVKTSPLTIKLFLINLASWLIFLAIMYLRWNAAYA